MSIDFPRAWQLCRQSKDSQHHPKCSYVRYGGGLLCDCNFIWNHPENLSYLFIGKDGEIIESWARRHLRHMWE